MYSDSTDFSRINNTDLYYMLKLFSPLLSKYILGLFFLSLVESIYAAGPVENDTVNFVEILKAASFANEVYNTEPEINAFFQSGSYSLTQYRTIPAVNISYFIATDDQAKKQIISIRGTSNIENAMIDVSLKLLPDEFTGIQLHQGFSLAARNIYSDIKPVVKKDYEIDVTGHSLGGAVAVILAMYLDTEQFNVGSVITFGQPKVTNIAGTQKFAHLNLVRVVTPLDLVPLVPLFDPLDINNVDIYWHGGREVLLLDGTQFSLLEGVNSMLRATKFTQQVLNEENLKNHKMTFYIAKLEKKKINSELVPFENSYNLFNLFGS